MAQLFWLVSTLLFFRRLFWCAVVVLVGTLLFSCPSQALFPLLLLQLHVRLVLILVIFALFTFWSGHAANVAFACLGRDGLLLLDS